MHATDVRDPVKDGVALAQYNSQIQIHFYRYVDLNVVVLFVGLERLDIETEDGLILQLRNIIKVDEPVLQKQERIC